MLFLSQKGVLVTKTSKALYFLISVIFFIVFDIYFSELILSTLRFQIRQNQLLDLIFIQNTGAAFSILQNSQTFLIIFSVFAILSIIVYSLRNAEKFSVFAGFWTAMLVAGIICNTYERIYFGYVRDFFKLNFVNFPVFNISDIFINIGVIALIIIIIKNKYLKNETNYR